MLVIISLALIIVQKNTNKPLNEISKETKQEELVQKIKRKLTVLEIKDQTIYGTIKFESTIENLEYIITPEENKIKLEKQTRQLAIDYELQNKQEYEFKVKVEGNEEETIIIVVDKDALPKVEIAQDDYANITKSEVILERIITMDKTEGFRTMYSLDNGETWQEYIEQIKTNQLTNAVIGQKVPINEEDVTITLERYVKMPNLAEDAIQTLAYDFNEETVEIANGNKYIKIVPEMEGFKIQILGWSCKVTFCNENKNTLQSAGSTGSNKYIVPEKARYVKINGNIKEIKVIPSVQFKITYLGQTKIEVEAETNGYKGEVGYEYYLNRGLKQKQTVNTYKYTGLIASGKYKIMVKATDKNGNTDETEKEIQTKANNNSIIGIITSDEIDSSRNIIKDAGGINYGFEITYLDKNKLPPQVIYESSTDTYIVTQNMEIGTATTDKMAVLKCDGNLIINEDVTITTPTYEITSLSGVTGNVTRQKGLFICCMGGLINRGTISQTARGTYQAPSENVYLWKNADGSYEYVPRYGGAGGSRTSVNNSSKEGKPGQNGIEVSKRATGGGGAGGVQDTREHYIAISGAGSSGNSYSGGKGGGGSSNSENPSDAGSDAGGDGKGARAAGGAGNPGGKKGGKEEADGSTGTGGLLIIYANTLINNGKIEAEGTRGGSALRGAGGGSGGGSVNLFYSAVVGLENISASRGEGGFTYVNDAGNAVSDGDGGDGGNGTVTSTKLIIGSKDEMLNQYKRSIILEIGDRFENEKVLESVLEDELKTILPKYGTIQYDKNSKILGVNTEFGKIILTDYKNAIISDKMKLSLTVKSGDYVEYKGSSNTWRALGKDKIVRNYDSTLCTSMSDLGCSRVRDFQNYLKDTLNWTQYLDNNVAEEVVGTLDAAYNIKEIRTSVYKESYWLIYSRSSYNYYWNGITRGSTTSRTVSHGLRPVVTLKDNLMTDGKNASGAWKIIQ